MQIMIWGRLLRKFWRLERSGFMDAVNMFTEAPVQVIFALWLYSTTTNFPVQNLCYQFDRR